MTTVKPQNKGFYISDLLVEPPQPPMTETERVRRFFRTRIPIPYVMEVSIEEWERVTSGFGDQT